MRARGFVMFAVASAAMCVPVPLAKGATHPVIVRKTQRARAMEHARRRGR